MKTLLKISVLAALAMPLVMADSIVANGDFETGDLTGWTTNNSLTNPWMVTGDFPESGIWEASTGCSGSSCVDQTNLDTAAYLTQNLITNPGDSYTLSFWFANAGAPYEIKALWDGNVVFDLSDPNATPDNYVNYVVSGLTAASTSTQLEFLGEQDSGYDYLDNITVVDNSSPSNGTPEPATWVFVVSGIALISARRLRILG